VVKSWSPGFAIAAAAVCASVACGSSEGRPDEELGGLVQVPRGDVRAVDIDKAIGDPDALVAAVGIPHRRVAELLGPHAFRGTSRLEVHEADAPVETLSDETAIDLDADGNYHATLANSRDYGRDVFYVAGVMYLRPRFGKFHRRAPADPGEPAQVRDEIYATLAAYLEPLASRAELTDGGTRTVAGRPTRVVKIKTAPKSRPATAEKAAHRKWREAATAEAVEGEVALDTETGIPLAAKLSGRLTFTRDGRTFAMKLAVTHTIGRLGEVAKLTAPPADDTIATYQRLREVDEREALLRGIAPPARRAPTPQNPTGEEQASP
jgi:hypothetical protein